MRSLHQQLADAFSAYVRAIDGVERNRLGALIDALAARVLSQPKGTS